MAEIDWLILSLTLAFIVSYGVIKTRSNKNLEEYLKGGNSSNWWTIGLSVMATQASAITFLSTPGQAFTDGMTFVQFYFGLPLAIIVICMVFIPIYHKLKVYTAYEYLESRFDLKTRTLAAVLFLIQRGLAAGITIYAPSIILSTVLGWDLKTLNIIIGFLVIIYTVSGGTKAVSITQKQQMFVIMAGMFAAFFIIIDLVNNSSSEFRSKFFLSSRKDLIKLKIFLEYNELASKETKLGRLVGELIITLPIITSLPNFVSSVLPPEDPAKSKITLPNFISLIVLLSIKIGAFLPGIIAVVIIISISFALS